MHQRCGLWLFSKEKTHSCIKNCTNYFNVENTIRKKIVGIIGDYHENYFFVMCVNYARMHRAEKSGEKNGHAISAHVGEAVADG